MAMTFTAARTSVFGPFCVGLAVVTGFEMPVVHLLAHHASWLVHLVIIAVNVWTWVWLFRERREMLAATHTLDERGLTIALARRWKGVIERGKILSAQRPASARPQKGTLKVTPMDAPNVELILSEPVTLTATWGRARSGSRVLLFVDEPDALVGALTATRPPAP
jgi:hypothetical protein